MIRVALLLIGLTLASLGGWSAPASGALVDSMTQAEEDHDCCPEQPDSEEDDCCDTDLGKCCGNGLVHLASAPAGLPEPAWAGSDADAARPPWPLHPRAIGPPPTPPPIA